MGLTLGVQVMHVVTIERIFVKWSNLILENWALIDKSATRPFYHRRVYTRDTF